MLIRLIPDQVESRWEYFAPAIAKALPPTVTGTKRAMVNLLEAILLGKLTVWIITDEDQESYHGILTSKFEYDDISKTRNLLIYSYTAISEVHYKYWDNTLDTLISHAVNNSCESVMAFSRNKLIENYFEGRGADIENTLLRLEV